MDALGSLAVDAPAPYYFVHLGGGDSAESSRKVEAPWETDSAAARLSRRGRAALALLLEASDYANDLGRDPWHFAIRAKHLRKAGLTDNDLRWLAYKQFVRFDREAGQGDGQQPHRAPDGCLDFTKKTRFVLTDEGIRFARRAVQQPAAAADSLSLLFEDIDGHGDSHLVLPKWDASRRELRVGAIIVKEYKVPAANQERILAAFEEERWPVHIDDPLPMVDPDKCKRRLHETINSLNRHQNHPLLRFLGDGRGEGVRWGFVRAG